MTEIKLLIFTFLLGYGNSINFTSQDIRVEVFLSPPDLDNKQWSTLLSEDFEAGLPSDWQVIDENNDGVSWTTGITGDLLGYDPPNYGTAYAYYSDYDAGGGAPPGVEELISPSIYIPASDSLLRLSFGWGFVFFNNTYGTVEVRFFSASSWGIWNQLGSYDLGNGTDTFDLTSYLPADSVQIKFVHYDPQGDWGYAFGVDNVLVEGFGPPISDVGVVSISSPQNWTPPLIPVTPSAQVENYGTTPAVFNVKFLIDSAGTNIYADSITGITLSPWKDTTVSFTDWTPGQRGNDYFATVLTLFPDDSFPDNDTLTKAIRTYRYFGEIDTSWTYPGPGGFTSAGITFCTKDTLFYWVSINDDYVYTLDPFTFNIAQAFPTDNPGAEVPWGISWDPDSQVFWISHTENSMSYTYNKKYLYNGTYTGTYYDVTGIGGSSWMGAMDYRQDAEWTYQLAVGGDNKVYKLDLHSQNNLGSIDSVPWQVSQRALTYLPWSGYLISGGWSQRFLYKIDTTGAKIETSLELGRIADIDAFEFLQPGEEIWGILTLNDLNNPFMKVYLGEIVPLNVEEIAPPKDKELSISIFPSIGSKIITISFSLPVASFVSLRLYNITGKKVTTLYQGSKEKGNYTFKFSTDKIPSGVYFINLKRENVSIIRKTVIIK